MTASERIRAARLAKDKALVGALDQNPVETRKSFTAALVEAMLEAGIVPPAYLTVQIDGYSVKVKP